MARRSGKKVVMLIVSDGKDIRAHKEAMALQEQGYDVTMVGRSAEFAANRDWDQDGVHTLVTPQIKDGKDLVRYARRTKGLTLRDRLWASYLAFVWQAAGLRFAAGDPAPYRNEDLTWPQRIAGYMHRLGTRADANRQHFGRTDPKKLSQFTKWVIRSLGYRSVWLARLLSYIPDTLFRRPKGAAIVGFNLAMKILPESQSKRVRNRMTALANQLRPRANYFLYYLESDEAVRELRPSVVHAHDLYMLQAAVKTARKSRARVVYDAHEYEAHRNHNMTDILRKQITRQEGRYVSRSDGVITISDSTAACMAENLRLKHIELIYNSPVTRGFDRNQGRDIRSDAGLAEDVPLALFVGKVYDIHQHDHRINFLIQAMAHIPDMHLVLLSITTPRSVRQIEEWAERYFVADRVHLVDPVPYSELINYIRTADVGVYAMPARCLNIEFSMPNKLFEYALAGIPLAVSNLTDAVRFVEELEIGEAFDPSDVRDIVQTLQAVYERRDKYRMDDERLAAAQLKYGWEAQGEKLNRLYTQVLKGRRPAHRGLLSA